MITYIIYIIYTWRIFALVLFVVKTTFRLIYSPSFIKCPGRYFELVRNSTKRSDGQLIPDHKNLIHPVFILLLILCLYILWNCFQLSSCSSSLQHCTIYRCCKTITTNNIGIIDWWSLPLHNINLLQN